MIRVLCGIVSIFLLFLILQDGFETIVLPRRVNRKFRLARLFFWSTWSLWSTLLRKPHKRRESYLSIYGPLSLLLLLTLWASVLIFSFALLQWSFNSPLNAPEKTVTFTTYLYMSGTTFFTLGFGDVVPQGAIGRICAVGEAGVGFAFLAVVIGYVPVIYQAFSHREVEISLLDARAGSPPTASEMLRRHIQYGNMEELLLYLHTWEHWCAELLESHLSYPVLTYYRSQHDRQSWIAALTTILDVSALIMVGLNDTPEHAARFTFAIARHAAVDLAQVFGTPPSTPGADRLTSEQYAQLLALLQNFGITVRDAETAEHRLADLRRMYEPFVNALANHLLLPLPEWVATTHTVDDWETSAWDHFAMTSERPLRKARH